MNTILDVEKYGVKEVSEERIYEVGGFKITVNTYENSVSVVSEEWPDICGCAYWGNHDQGSLWDFIATLPSDRYYTQSSLFRVRMVAELDHEATRVAILRAIGDDVSPGGRPAALEALNRLGVAPETFEDQQLVAPMGDLEDPWRFEVHRFTKAADAFWAAWCPFCAFVAATMATKKP